MGRAGKPFGFQTCVQAHNRYSRHGLHLTPTIVRIDKWENPKPNYMQRMKIFFDTVPLEEVADSSNTNCG